MNSDFAKFTEQLETKYAALMSMPPVIAEEVPGDTPVGGIYLFSEQGIPLYTGRTRRRIAIRIRNHFSTAPDCPFAWLLTREVTGFKATYRREGSRRDLLLRDDFVKLYQEAKTRIRKMDVQYVAESNPLRQTLLEVYTAVSAKSRYNDYDTH